MKYFNFYPTNSPVIKAKNGEKFSYDPNDSDSVRAFQREAIRLGYLDAKLANGKDADDGIDGKATRAALAAMNQNGGIRKITTEQAKDKYQNTGRPDGLLSVMGDAISHVILPEWANLRTNKSAKKQAAAAIAEQGIPKSGTGILDYEDWGRLSDQSSNPNEQGAKDNAAGKTIGMATYKLSPDGKSVIVEDSYDFHVERTPVRDESGNIVKWNTDGKQYDYLNGDRKSGWGVALRGLYEDVFKNGMLSADYKPNGESVGFGKRLEHLGENFGTRQGKTRDSSFEIPIKRINRWNE